MGRSEPIWSWQKGVKGDGRNEIIGWWLGCERCGRREEYGLGYTEVDMGDGRKWMVVATEKKESWRCLR